MPGKFAFPSFNFGPLKPPVQAGTLVPAGWEMRYPVTTTRPTSRQQQDAVLTPGNFNLPVATGWLINAPTLPPARPPVKVSQGEGIPLGKFVTVTPNIAFGWDIRYPSTTTRPAPQTPQVPSVPPGKFTTVVTNIRFGWQINYPLTMANPHAFSNGVLPTSSHFPASPPLPPSPPISPPVPVGPARSGIFTISRAPDADDWRVRSHIDKVTTLLNSLLRQGYISVEGGDFKINTGAFARARLPTVTDDRSVGAVVGSLFINTITDSVYICTSNTIGAAVWKFVA